MGKPKYNWGAVDRALEHAERELSAVRRNRRWGKRVNALNELVALEQSIRIARRHLEEPMSVDAVAQDSK